MLAPNRDRGEGQPTRHEGWLGLVGRRPVSVLAVQARTPTVRSARNADCAACRITRRDRREIDRL